MHRLIALAALAPAVLSPPVVAQVASAPNHVVCTVMDAGRTPVKVWGSQVFTSTIPGEDVEAYARLAGAFLQHVATTAGGAGEKTCVAMASVAEAEGYRQQQRALWDKKVGFMRIGIWYDVAWTPPPMEALQVSSAPVPRYFRCGAILTDVPGGRDRAWSVSSGVFEQSVPGDRALAAGLAQEQAYRQEFGVVAQAHGIPAETASCSGYDSLAEADKDERDFVRLATGVNLKYTATPWRPSGKPVPSAPAVAPAAPVTPVTPAPVVATLLPKDAPAAASPPAVVTSQALYCFGMAQRTNPQWLWLRTPIAQQASADASPAAQGAHLARFFAAVKAAYPDKWRDDKINCFDTSQVFPGETMCIANSFKHFGGGQSVVTYCNASREALDARSQRVDKDSGGRMQQMAWPQ